MTPLISFIIPVYNLPEDMLTECVESILALPLDDNEREIIVVEDGSPMPCGNIAERYGKQIRYVNRKQNLGVSAARNYGLSQSTGQYIQFVDGDDTLIGNGYAEIIELLRNKKPDAVAFNFTNSQPEPHDIKTNCLTLSGIELMKNYNIRSMVWCYIYKRCVISEIRFDEATAYAEDDEFVTRALLNAKTIVSTDTTAYYYRERASSAVGNKSEEKIAHRLNDIRSVIGRIAVLRNENTGEAHKALARRTAQLTMNYIYLIIVLTGRKKELDIRIDDLKRNNLFPLPLKLFTAKYLAFSIMANNNVGRKVLVGMLGGRW